MDRAVEQPLGVHLRLPPKRESIHALVVSHVPEYGFDRMHPPAVDPPRFGKVDLAHHPLLERVLGLADGNVDAAHLPRGSLKAPLLQRAIRALLLAHRVAAVEIVALPAPAGAELEQLAAGADVPVVLLVVFKIRILELGLRLGLVPLAPLEGGIALAEAAVGNVGVHAVLFGGGEIVFAVILAIRAQIRSAQGSFLQLAFLQVLCRLVESMLCHLVVVTGSLDPGVDDDLPLLVHQGLGVVALDVAVAGLHGRRVRIGDVADDLLAGLAFLRLVPGEEGVDLPRVPLETGDLIGVARILGLDTAVGSPVLGHLLLDLRPDALALAGQVGMLAAPFPRGVGGQLHAIEREVRVAQQSRLVAGEKDLLEDLLGLLTQLGDEGREGAVVRTNPAAQSHEDYISPARLFHPARGEDALAVGVEHDLEQQPRIVGLLAGFVVVVAPLEALEPDAVVDEMVDGVLERAGEQLLLQIDGHHQVLGVIVILESSHSPYPIDKRAAKQSFISF